ncbi:hypothetical protein Goari_024258 [Gossypium aridum]|uniref:Uncharacterized protein n=1 Tax=Gossypium aridum TaxID=34290 RepID=A0A7J8X6X2_GOSAI|nr:hypothetical protein [Gossypium aridum]
MATKAISRNDDDNHQSINTATPVAGSSPNPGCLLILEGYRLHEFVLETISVPPQSIVDREGNLVVVQQFATKPTMTVSTLRHSLYSQKKRRLTIKEYLAKIKGLCDTLMAAGNAISEQE